VQLSIDDGLRFQYALEVVEVQRSGVSGVVRVADLVGHQLFVTPDRGRLVLGRYTFPLAGLGQAAAFVHQKRCVFEEAETTITALQFAKVKVGQTMAQVQSLLAPKNCGHGTDDKPFAVSHRPSPTSPIRGRKGSRPRLPLRAPHPAQ
jgi:hypothetical protein